MGSPAFGQRRMKGVRADQKQLHDQDPCVADDRNDEPGTNVSLQSDHIPQPTGIPY